MAFYSYRHIAMQYMLMLDNKAAAAMERGEWRTWGYSKNWQTSTNKREMCTINNSFAAIYNVEVARENEKLMRYLKIAHSCFSLYVADKQQNIQRKMHFISSYATDFLECKPVSLWKDTLLLLIICYILQIKRIVLWKKNFVCLLL